MRLTGVVIVFLLTSALLPGQGIITTMAGNPYAACGPLGDGGPATSAELCNEQSPAVDGSGNIYFYDAGNYRIRKITPGGTITTIDGTCTGYSGVPRGPGGPGGGADIYDAWGRTQSPGALYIASGGNFMTRRGAQPPHTISAVRGSGSNNWGDSGPALPPSIVARW